VTSGVGFACPLVRTRQRDVPDIVGLSAVTLLRRHKLDAAVAVPIVVPVDKRRHPLAGLVLVGKWPSRVIRPLLRCAEQRFGVGVVIADARPRERPEHAQLFQPALQRCRTHDVAVIGVQDQRLLSLLADPLSQAIPAHQIGCNGWVFPFGDIPSHHFAAPDIDHQVEVKPDPAHGGGQVGDVPAPHLIWTSGPEPWHRS